MRCADTYAKTQLTTLVVHLEMDGTLRENRSRSRFHFVEYKPCPIFCQYTRREGPVHGKVELSRAGMCMGSIVATGSKETNGHGHPCPDEGRERPRVGRYCMTARTEGFARSGVKEVEDELQNRQGSDCESAE